MYKLYKSFLPLFCIFLLFPLTGFCTHIVGGSLTYVYNGGTSYTITLRLYKDCSGGAAAFDATADIDVQQADGSEFSPSRDFTLSTVSTVSVSPSLPPCATAPASMPCVQERTYSATVNLAAAPGGMHLYYQVCCRNGSISNISTPSSVGESYYTYIPCYYSAWSEDFTLANGTTSDAGATAWTRTLSCTAPTSAQVNNGLFEVNGANSTNTWLEDFTLANGTTSDAGPTAWTRTVSAGVTAQVTTNQLEVTGAVSGSMTWTSQVIDISSCISGVNLSAALSEASTLEAGDIITISYSLNGGALVNFPVNGSLANDFTNATATASNLTGSTLQLFVTVQYDASDAGEIYRLDNVTVSANAAMTWSSQVINIAAYASGVNLSMNLSESSTLEATDNITVSYSLDGGARVNFPTNGSMSDDFGSVFATATGLTGTTVQLFVTVKYDAASAGEIYTFDMATVYNNAFVSNSSPVFDVVPPLLFCQTYQDTIDYSATDADGDVLVYSLYTPYENASPCCAPYTAPTFTNNTAVFSTITWLAGYSATSPLNSGGPSLSINSSTGEVSGVANTNGRFVFGIKCQEYRGGVLLGETTRGYQVTTVVCPPFVPAAPTTGTSNSSPICSGQTLSLTASTISGATSYQWNGPNGFSSTSQNPTIPNATTAASGTYSVYASVSGCNGTVGLLSVTVSPTPATPSAGSNSTVCSGQTLSLTANTVAGSTYNWSGPNGFTATSQNPVISNVTTSASGTYTVTRTSAIGCVSTATTTPVTVNQTPTAPTAGSNSAICSGQTLSLTASSTGTTYSWTGPNSFTSSSQNPTIAGATTAASGNYSVTATTSGCASTAGTTSVTVKSNPAAPTAGSNSPVCTGQTLSLTANTIASASYSWTGPNSFTSAAEDPTIASVTTAHAGNYSVTATVAGCTGPAGATSVVVNVTPVAPSTASNSPICTGQNLTLAASNIAGATYSWTGPNSFSSASQNPSVGAATTAAAGNYSVTATVSGCTGPAGIESVTVNVTPSAPVASSNSPVCSGQTLSLSCGTVSGASYSWSGPNSFSSSSQNPTVSSVTTSYTGTYSITATVAGCGSAAGTTSVTINQTPGAPTAGSNSPVCSGSTLSLTASTISGATYAWTGPNSFSSVSQNPTITSITTAGSGNYSVTATVAGCTGPVGTVSVTINQTPAAPTASSNSPICAGTTLSLTASTISGASYSWSGPNSFSSASQNPTITSITTAGTGNYSVTATVAGCTGPAGTTSVTVNPIPAAPTAGSNSPVCSGSTLSLTASTISGATYAWTGPNSFSSASQNPTITSITTAGSGNYSVTATVAGCAGPVGTVSVTINQTPAAPTASSNSPICAGTTLSLTASTISGATYSWTGPNSFSSASQNPTIASITTAGSGNYSVTATVAGCTGPAGTTSVTVNPIPAAPTAGSNSPVCSGSTLSLTASTISGATYAWTGPNSFSSASQNSTIASITTAGSGNYSVTATVAGCAGPAGTVSVTINQTPAAPTVSSNSPICAGTTLSLTASTISGATYSWTGPNSFASASQNPTIASITTAGSGNYSVTATVAGCTGPAGTTSVTVNPIPAVPTAGSNSPVCSGSTLSLTASTISGATYAWTGPNSFSSASQNPTIVSITTAGSGNYSVTATVSGCTGPVGTVSVTINQTPAAPTASSNSPLCTGTTLSLTASTISGATYSWTGPNSFASASQNPTITSVTTAGSGNYSVTATVAGCTGTAGTVSVTISPPPATPSAGSNNPVCTGYDLSLTANTIAGAIYNWTGPNGFSSGSEDPVISAITTAAAGTYSVNVTVNGCAGATGITSVTVNVAPASPTAGSNTPVCSGQTLNLTATATGVSYTWTGPNGFSSTSQNPSIAAVTTAASGTYSVTATGANGCGSSPANTTSVTIIPTPTAPVVGSNSPACAGGNISLTATTFAGATYIWNASNGFFTTAQNPVITGISTADAGTYSVVATLAGCVGPVGTGIVVVNSASSTPVLGSNSPVCTGQSLNLTTDAVPAGTYHWSGPNTFTSSAEDPTIAGVTVAAAGTYSLFITVPGCITSGTGTLSVTVNTTPAAPAPAGNNSPICSGNDLSLSSATVGAVTYNWSGPNGFTSTSEDPVISVATSAAGGTYSVTVTSAAGCTSSFLTTAAIVNQTPSAPSAGNNGSLCTGATLSLTASTISGATYSWTGPSSYTSSLQNPVISNVTTANAGSYSVTATVAGCTGPAGTTSVTISVPQTTTPGSNTPVCAGQTLSLTASTVASANYSWTGPNSFSSSLQDPAISSATTAANGTYSVTVTIAGCTGPATITSVTVNPAPASPVPGSNSPVCVGSTLSLSASTVAGTTYLWNGPNTYTSSIQNPVIANVTTADAGTYSITATNSTTGCVSSVSTTSVTIHVIPAAPVAGATTPVCSGQTLSLTASTVGGSTYAWTGPNSYSSTSQNPLIANITTAGTGTYSVTAIENGCTSPAATATAVVNQTPSAPVAGSNTPVCAGNTLSLTASTAGSPSYSWTGPNSFSSVSQNPTIPAITSADAGTYSVTATSNGCTGATGVTSVTVTPIPAAPVASSNSTVCSGQTLNLFASTISGATYTWAGPNGFSSVLQNPSITSVSTAANGTYSVTATVNGCPGPAGTTIVTINQTPAAPAASSNSPVCSGQTLSLTAGTVGGSTYSWTGPNGFTSALQNPVIAAVTTAATGVYAVIATENGCIGAAGTTTVTINQTPSVPVAANNSTICEGQTLSLTAATISGATYAWTGPNSFSSASQNPVISNVTTVNAGTYSVNATVAGCAGPYGTTPVSISPTPASPVAGSNTSICSGQTLSLTASTVGSSTYTWSGPLSYSSSLQNPTIASVTTAHSGTYSVTATENGCTSPAGIVSVTINPTPSITALSNGPVCLGNTISLAATTIAGTNYSWTGPNSFSSTSQNPTIAAAATVNSGTYTVNATSSVGCLSPNAVHTLTVTPLITVNAGADQTVCGNNANVSHTGVISGGSTTGIWTSTGTGLYLPDVFALDAIYIPTPADTATGIITFTLTSTSNGGCAAVTDAMTVIITDAPTSNAGADQTVCANNANVVLNGSVNSTASGGAWTTSGTGTFTPDNLTLAATYIPGTADTAAGSVVLTLTTTGVGLCSPVADQMTVTITNSPRVNAGATIYVCSNNANAVLNGSSTTGSGVWTTSGTGTFTPSAAVLTTTFVPSAADIAGGSVNLVLTSASNGSCNSEDDTVTVIFTPPPAVTAGADQTVCANNNQLTVTGTSTTGACQWTSSGTGIFASSTSLSTTYTPSAADNAAGSVLLTISSTNNGGCLAVTDQLTVIITPAPTANAGANQTVCANNPVVTLNGSFTVATGGTWTSTGTGTFSGVTNMNGTYTPSAADTAAGSVDIILTTTGNGLCTAVTSTMTITISNAPLVNAGAAISVCVNNPNASLNGSSSTGSGTWTTLGGGSFSPNNTTLNASYIPSAGDIAAGNVTLILTSANNGSCNPENDSVTVAFTPQPTANAGNDATVCANNGLVSLSGASSTGSGTWTTSGTGTFSPTANALNATYTPSTADNTAGNVTLTLTTANNGGCLAVTDQLTVTITPAPVANAGPDQTVCANNAVVTLSGSFTVATGAAWTSSGTGIFSSTTGMNATYTPSSADTAAGTVTITLTTTGNGLCNAVTDAMVITITGKPIVNAGINSVACKNNPNYPLTGSSSTGSGIWTTSGTGTFTPTATTLNATYIPSTADTTAGSVILILTSSNNGNCSTEDDSVTITYIAKPIVNAGADQTVCANNALVTLSGTSNTSSGQWSTIGTGTFTVSGSLATTYAPSAADIVAGSVQLVLASTNNGTCNPVTDTLTVSFSTSPTVNAGADQTVCANNAIVTLNGAFTVSSGAGWTTLGSGTFSPDTMSMNAVYTASAADTSAGSITLYLTTTGNGTCLSVKDSMMVTITDAPKVNAGADQLVCLSNPVATLTGTASTGSGTWSTIGTGTFTSTVSLNTIYTASNADTAAGSVKLVLTSTANGNCNAVTDTILLSFVTTPAVNAGTDQTVCANADTVLLGGSSSTGSGIWTTAGTGTFTPSASSLATTYIPGLADVTSGSVILTLTSTGGCTPVADNMTITITPTPVVNAGTDQIICAGTQTVALGGLVSAGASTGIWSTNGTGTFTPTAANLNAVYHVTSADSAAGYVTVYLTSTNNGNCFSEMDSMNISIIQPPAVNAGPDQTVCALPTVQLNGAITGGSGTGFWSTVGGGGIFLPDSTALNAYYHPSSSDTAFGGTLTLVLTSTNNGNCSPSRDTVVITFIPPPTADAWNDIVACKNNADSLKLAGIVKNAGGGQWSILNGSGSFSPSDTSLNGYYIPDSMALTKDTVVIVLTTTGNGSCPAATDTMLILFTPSPVVDAGADIPICFGDTTAQLIGSVTAGSTTGHWTTLGSGSFVPSADVLNATYFLSTADINAGSITLILASTNNGNCDSVFDTLNINIEAAPVVSAGTDITVCGNNANAILSGSIVSVAGTGVWTSNGTGTFTPDSITLNATYIPSSADTAAGKVVLILTSTNGCKPIADSLTVTITNAPTVNAGTDISICEGSTVALNGSINSAASGAQWTSSGNGTFLPNSTTLNAMYIPGSSDTGIVTITLTTTGNGQCLAVKDSLTITIGRKPLAGFSVPHICTGQSITFTDTSSVVGLNDTIISWNWTIGNNPYTVQNPVHTFTASGTNTVVLVVTTAIGCSDTAMYPVHINPTPAASYTVLTTCSLDSVYFTSTSSISGGNIVSWNWNFGDAQTSTLQNPVHYYDSSGVYIVSLTVTSDSGCSAVFTDTVIPAKGTIANFLHTSDCSFNVHFTDTSFTATGDSIISWSWNFGDGSALSTAENPSHTYADTGTYIVTLHIVTLGGCSDDKKDTIILLPAPVADFEPKSGTYNTGTTVAFTDLSTHAFSWLWNFGDGGTDSVQNPSHTYNQNGTLNVVLIVTNTNGCTDTVQYAFRFNTNVVVIPSAFTPNGDNINDVLMVRGGPLKEMDWRIFNEWGNQVFRATSQSEGWDGRYKGKLQPETRYVFILNGTTFDNEKVELNGEVTILR